MGSRKPLNSWVDLGYCHLELPNIAAVHPSMHAPVESQVFIRPTGGRVVAFLAPDPRAAQLAAEDAARALVAEMAAALGGSVAWADAQEVGGG